RRTCELVRLHQHPGWRGVVSAAGTPLRALCVMGTLCAAAAALSYVAGWNIPDLLPLSTSSFIATYVLSMAAAMRLLDPPLRYAAAVSLAACVGVLFFAWALLVWMAGVAACSGGYPWLVTRRLTWGRGRHGVWGGPTRLPRPSLVAR